MRQTVTEPRYSLNIADISLGVEALLSTSYNVILFVSAGKVFGTMSMSNSLLLMFWYLIHSVHSKRS